MNEEVKNYEAELRSILDTEGSLSEDQVARAEELEGMIDEKNAALRSDETRKRVENRLATGKFSTNTNVETRSEVEKYADWAITGQEYRDGNHLAGTDAAGGYLVPLDLQNELIKKMNGVAAARQAVDVRTYNFDVEIARVDTRPSIVAFTGEGAAYDAIGVTFDQVRSYAFKSAAESYISEELLQDNRPSTVAEILDSHAEAHALFWDGQYLADGVGSSNGPEKIFDATVSGLNTSESAAVDTITLDDLYAAYFDALPAQNRGGNFAWVMHPSVESVLRQEEDTTGRKLLTPQATGTDADGGPIRTNILGFPVYVSTQAPTYADAKASANVPALMLMEKSSYRIFDRMPFVTQRDEYSKGSEGKVVFRSKMRSDGRWLAPWRSVGLTLRQS